MVVVITLNYNQNEYTLSCIDSLLKTDYRNFLILLVDNGSNKENFKCLQENLPIDSRLKLTRIEDNIGYVGGINFGLSAGAKLNPKYFLILNNDTLIDPNAIGVLLNTCKGYKDKSIVTGKVFHYDRPNIIQDVGYEYSHKKTLKFKRIGLDEVDHGQFDMICERDMIDDVFWLFSIKLYNKIGGYSPFFWFNAEQADFALRAKKEGYNLIYTPLAKLWHKGSVSIGGRFKNPKLVYWHIQSSLILRFLHLKRFYFIKYFITVAYSVLITAMKSLFYRLKGDKSWMEYSKAKFRGLQYFLKWVVIKNNNTGKNYF